MLDSSLFDWPNRSGQSCTKSNSLLGDLDQKCVYYLGGGDVVPWNVPVNLKAISTNSAGPSLARDINARQ